MSAVATDSTASNTSDTRKRVRRDRCHARHGRWSRSRHYAGRMKVDAASLLQNRQFVRAPIPLFRAGLGFLFTRRLLMLEHVGRTSGAARYVVLEVVERESSTSFVVASGFGRHSQWYRNLLAEPHCHVSTGLVRRRPAVATVLSAAEGDAILARYQQQHPGAWEKLAAIIVKATGDPDPDIPLVRLSLRAELAAGRGCQRGPTLRLCPDTRADSETCPAG